MDIARASLPLYLLRNPGKCPVDYGMETVIHSIVHRFRDWQGISCAEKWNGLREGVESLASGIPGNCRKEEQMFGIRRKEGMLCRKHKWLCVPIAFLWSSVSSSLLPEFPPSMISPVGKPSLSLCRELWRLLWTELKAGLEIEEVSERTVNWNSRPTFTESFNSFFRSVSSTNFPWSTVWI